MHTHTHLSSRYISLNTLPSAYDHWYQAWRGSTYFRVVKARTLHTQALCCIVAWHTVQQSRCHNTQSAVIIMTHAICPLGPPRGFARGWHQLISRSRLPLSRQFFCRVLWSEKKMPHWSYTNHDKLSLLHLTKWRSNSNWCQIRRGQILDTSTFARNCLAQRTSKIWRAPKDDHFSLGSQPNVTWYGMVSHMVPSIADGGVTIGTWQDLMSSMCSNLHDMISMTSSANSNQRKSLPSWNMTACMWVGTNKHHRNALPQTVPGLQVPASSGTRFPGSWRRTAALRLLAK